MFFFVTFVWLQMSDLSAMETRKHFEEQNMTICDLRNRLADAEVKLVEGEKLRKKLHNTILVDIRPLNFRCDLNTGSLKHICLQELKGNIRVFCRVRPLLPDEGSTTDSKVIAFPTSMEAMGRGVDLLQNGTFKNICCMLIILWYLEWILNL